LRDKRVGGKKAGFVPTMGALHEGHLSLIRRSKEENSITVCSIFVNPIQFTNRKDLERYPRNLKEDSRILEEAGCDILFSPEVNEMYRGETNQFLDIDLGALDKVLEGKFRPGHFKGVVTIVKKLLDIIEPDHCYLGQKDYQQFLVINFMAIYFRIPVDIIGCPIVREPDGLAMSSRNLQLTIGERELAPLIYETLYKVRKRAGTVPVKELQNWAIKKINDNPAFNVEYFEIVDKTTLLPVETWNNRQNSIALTAVYLGDIRLIDNMELF
jgi:pantoate--beta-alanine ligase